MKRTSTITLAILGALALSGCSNEPNVPTTYASVSDCVSDGHSSATCRDALASATKQTEQSAPKFNSAADCQAQFANCQKSSSGDWFMPAVMGYMVGSMMSDGHRSAATPVYIDRSGRSQAAGFVGGAYRPVPAAQSYSAKTAAARSASTSSRGGFGSRASSSSS